jgi:hypothetical protein
VSIPDRGEQWIAEAAYNHFRRLGTREQMAKLIDNLLSDNTVPQTVKNIVIRMAMIFSAEEGHS